MITVINCKYLVTLNSDLDIFKNYSLIIKDDKILDILPQLKAKEKYQNVTRTINFNKHAVMPGLINAHTHLPATFMRGYADDLPLETWLKKKMWPVENKIMCSEFIYESSIYSICEMLLNGITCFNDMFFFSEDIAKAANDSKVRANIGTHIFDYPTPWVIGSDQYIKQGLDVYQQYKNHELISASLNPHAPYSVSDETFIKVRDAAEKYNMKICCHLHETKKEVRKSLKQYGMRPVERLNKLGILNSNFQAVHMTQWKDEEIELFKNKNIKVIHCPESNLKLASGICPTQKLLRHGITVGIGTDGAASNNDLDILLEMRTASLIAKIHNQDPTTMPALEVLNMATLNNAEVMGLEDKIGSLEINKQADFIAIDMDNLNTQPLFDLTSQLIYSTNSYQVTDVFVAGIQLVKDRDICLFSKDYLIGLANKWKEKIKAVI